MKKKILCALPILLLLSVSLWALTEEEIEKIRQQTWVIRIETNIEGIFPQGVQYALFENNPMEALKEDLAMYKKHGKKRNFPEDKEEERAFMIVSWNRLFRNHGGDEIYLLPTKTGRRSFSMSSSSKGSTKWIVTKVAYSEEKTLCWAVKANVEIGKTTTVVLDHSNVTDLKELYENLKNQK